MLNIEQHSGIQMIANPHTTSGFTPSFLSKRETEPVRHLHMSLDDYAATPLVELSALARRSGVRYIAEPGGSIRDDLVIGKCNDYDMVMAFTGIRLFHH